MNCIKCNSATSVVDSRPQETVVVKETVKVSKPKIKTRDTFDDPFDDPNYLESLSDYELEELIGG